MTFTSMKRCEPRFQNPGFRDLFAIIAARVLGLDCVPCQDSTMPRLMRSSSGQGLTARECVRICGGNSTDIVSWQRQRNAPVARLWIRRQRVRLTEEVIQPPRICAELILPVISFEALNVNVVIVCPPKIQKSGAGVCPFHVGKQLLSRRTR